LACGGFQKNFDSLVLGSPDYLGQSACHIQKTPGFSRAFVSARMHHDRTDAEKSATFHFFPESLQGTFPKLWIA
jgi:hypothetical protein